MDAVDIILPTHRRPHTVGYSIAAVLAQTYRTLTLHVVGDGCDDATAAVVTGHTDPRVRFHRFPKARGFGYANRNRVLGATSAPFIAYANDDDLWFPDHLERGLRELEQRHLDLVAFRSIHVHPPDRLDPHFFAFDWRRPPGAAFLRNWFMGAGTLVHRRSVFARTGYWNDQLFRFGDREFYNRVRCSGLPSAYVDEVSVLRFYAQHWDARYAALAEPPQQRYLPLLADAAWRTAVRTAAAAGRRGGDVRLRQWQDLARFAIRSGPKFARFWYERWTAHAPQPPADASPHPHRSGR
jgi:glycosyltransferase involved in cell wall biosynthesis